MATINVRGIKNEQEVNPQTQMRDTRYVYARFSSWLSSNGNASLLIAFLAILPIFIPHIADIVIALVLLLTWFVKTRVFALPIKLPKSCNLIDPHELNPKDRSALPAAGIFYLGVDMHSGEEIWASGKDASTHQMVIGTTGSGKTEFLLGLCENVLVQGSGFTFVDGKAQNKIFKKIYDLVRKHGRDDDLLCMNFMTGPKDIIGPQKKKISNTTNQFARGTASMISQLVISLMSASTGGDDMWKDRAIAFVESLSPPLRYLRDHFGLLLNVNEYRKYFELERIEDLAWKGNERYPGLDAVLDPLRYYLVNLPGYDRAKYGKKGGQTDDTRNQHGFITMQLVRAFTSLSDTYGHIVRTPLGEIDYRDVVMNRRILVVMLPSLEKSQSECANLGKMVVTAIKTIMVEGLGPDVEGDARDFEDTGAAALPTPYMVILDEYGYYAVEGFSIAFAQARSLNFAIVVGAQDLASFQKRSKEEATSIIGNTSIKWFGKVEDPGDTMKLAVDLAGKGMVARMQAYEGDSGMMADTTYRDNLNATLELMDRVNPNDLREQIAGEFTAIWTTQIIRAKCFFVNPPATSKARLNHFIPVMPPEQELLDDIEMSSSGIMDRIGDANLADIIEAQEHSGAFAPLLVAAQAFENHSNLLPVERGITALILAQQASERREQIFMEKLVRPRSGASQIDSPLYRKLTEPMELSGSARSARSIAGVSADVGPGDAIIAEDDYVALERTVAQRRHGSGGERPAAHVVRDTDLMPDAGLSHRLDPAYDDITDSVPVPVYVERPQMPEILPEDAARAIQVEITDLDKMNVFSPPLQTRTEGGGFGRDVMGSAESERARQISEAVASDDDPALLDYNSTLSGLEEIEKAMGADEDQSISSANQVVRQIEEATSYPNVTPQTKSREDLKGMFEELESLLLSDDER